MNNERDDMQLISEVCPTEVASGRAHYERRRAQAAAAQKVRLKSKHDYDWKKEQQ